MEFPSRELYEGQLQAHPSVREHRLCDMPGVADSPGTQRPLEFIDTAGASYDEELEPDGESRLNRQEAQLLAGKVRELLDAGAAARDIGVISPYARRSGCCANSGRARPGDRQCRRLPGPREGGGGDFAGAEQPPRRDRLSRGHPPHERGHDSRPAEADHGGRQCHAGRPSLLRPAIGILAKGWGRTARFGNKSGVAKRLPQHGQALGHGRLGIFLALELQEIRPR